MVQEGDRNIPFLAGVDGCKSGWVVASETRSGQLAVEVVSCFSEVLDRGYQLLVVDVPMGLLEHGTRLADQEARGLLKQRACCVFTAPLRPMLDCVDYLEARQLRLQIEGKSLTRQAWEIMPKIKEVDAILTPQAQSRVREGHPEVSFAYMNGGKALSNSKHTANGRRDRISLLIVRFPHVVSLVQTHSRVAEDVIDACAMLWSAHRIYKKQALVLPKKSLADTRGLLMQIWV